jgi:hypothetical protein
MPIGRIVSIQRLGIAIGSLQIQHIRLEVQMKTGEMNAKLDSLTEIWFFDIFVASVSMLVASCG